MAERVELSGDKLQKLTNGEIPTTRVLVNKLNGQKYGVIKLENEPTPIVFKLHEDEWIDTVVNKIGNKCIKTNLTVSEYNAIANTLERMKNRINNEDKSDVWDDPEVFLSALEKIKQSV